MEIGKEKKEELFREFSKEWDEEVRTKKSPHWNETWDKRMDE